jgi:hypothetical protein
MIARDESNQVENVIETIIIIIYLYSRNREIQAHVHLWRVAVVLYSI